MTMDGELWHIVEAKRDDGTPTMFRIRELDPQRTLTTVFVVELPYPKTELSRLPNASDYRRLSEFDEQWLRPACRTLGWELVGSKTEDGSFFLYMYGATDPGLMIEKLSPFDAALGFYDDDDPDWREYGQLRELLEVAKAIPPIEAEGSAPIVAPLPAKRARAATTVAKANPTAKASPKAKATKATPSAKAAKTTAAKKAKPNAKAKAATPKAAKAKAAKPKAAKAKAAKPKAKAAKRKRR